MTDINLPADKTLLLVDDDKPFLTRLARAMETRGFEVRMAESVAEGIQQVKKSAPGYAVVDLRVLDPYDWRLKSGNLWKVERLLREWPHRPIASSDARVDAMRRRYREFRKIHAHKPWKYFTGRQTWTPLPSEFKSAIGPDTHP